MSTTALTPGTILTVAGNGEPEFSGDGGPAFAAGLNEPKAVAVDAASNLYIVDAENNLIRKVSADTGHIVTVAGAAKTELEAGPSVFAAPASSVTNDDDLLSDPPEHKPDRYVQVSDLSGTVRFVTGTLDRGQVQTLGDGGPATAASLNIPSGLAVARDGTLYIADTRHHRIRRVDAVTGIITTVAGTGKAAFSGDGGPAIKAMLNEPVGVALDEDRGSLYIADQSNNRVRRLDFASGIIATVTGTGEAGYNGDGIAATEASVAGPSGLVVGPDGTLYVADTFNGRIRAIDPESGVIRTVAGDGSQYRYQGIPNEWSTNVSRPHAIALLADGSIVMTDSDSHLIRRWDARKKIITRVAGTGAANYTGDGGPALEAALSYPFGIAADAQGHLFIADTFNHRIRKILA
ncbi:MAG: SMP-30/gluconolactonase/LRE family protein [Nitrospiraceae bacterium]